MSEWERRFMDDWKKVTEHNNAKITRCFQKTTKHIKILYRRCNVLAVICLLLAVSLLLVVLNG